MRRYIGVLLIVLLSIVQFSGCKSAAKKPVDPNKPSADRLIKQLTKNQNSVQRASAANDLGKYRYGKGNSHLINAVENDDDTVRISAIWALGRIKNPVSVPVLAKVFNNKLEKRAIRRKAIEALSNFKTGDAVAVMLKAVISTDREIKDYAIVGLGQSGSDTAVAPLSSLLKLDFGSAFLANAVTNLNKSKLNTVVFELLRRPNYLTRYNSSRSYVEHLGKIKFKKAIRFFVRSYLLNEYNERLRKSLLKAIKTIGLKNAFCMVKASSLRLRERYNIRSKVRGLLNKGVLARIEKKTTLRYTIDGISDFWYRVRASDKKQGWVFGGYLKVYDPKILHKEENK